VIADIDSQRTVSPETVRLHRAPRIREDGSADKTASRNVELARGLRRYETKYVIPPEMVPEIRKMIAPFCERDPNCSGDPPAYINNTLQLDSPGLSLHYAKLWDFVDRFKLRVRTYGNPVGEGPVFLEVKAKDRNMIYKYRSEIPFDCWGEHLFQDRVIRDIEFKSAKETNSFYQFIRLVKQIGAQPKMMIRYQRESYFGTIDEYARVTIDSRLEYQQTSSWNSWGRGGVWRALDNPMMQTRRHDKELNFSGVVLELKAQNDVPRWMIDVVTRMDLWRVGHCKYSNAIWAESMFRATPWTPEYEIDLLRHL
jgi:hypothetical protein